MREFIHYNNYLMIIIKIDFIFFIHIDNHFIVIVIRNFIRIFVREFDDDGLMIGGASDEQIVSFFMVHDDINNFLSNCL